ncbi:MAG: hypothetical protein QM612_03175 [Thermomonas sp.]|uniref:hypothetical protein n=1 Tax=Thermomonas sp. TaxID=1971895 RepID=UPI0039E53CE6
MKSIACGLIAMCLLPLSVAAGSVTSYGPVYSSNKSSIEKGGGCISGSIGDAIPGNRQASIYFVSEENTEHLRRSAYFGYADGKAHDDFLPGISTFTMCLKPGRYRIYGLATDIIYNKNLVNIPFEVEKGKHVYIGSFVLYGYSRNPDCPEATADVYAGFRDEFSRDLPHLKIPEGTSPIQVEKQLIDPKAGAPYFVTCNQ